MRRLATAAATLATNDKVKQTQIACVKTLVQVEEGGVEKIAIKVPPKAACHSHFVPLHRATPHSIQQGNSLAITGVLRNAAERVRRVWLLHPLCRVHESVTVQS